MCDFDGVFLQLFSQLFVIYIWISVLIPDNREIKYSNVLVFLMLYELITFGLVMSKFYWDPVFTEGGARVRPKLSFKPFSDCIWASFVKIAAHHIPLGSGAMPPQPKSGGKASAKLVIHEIPTKPKDTALLLTRHALACKISS